MTAGPDYFDSHAHFEDVCDMTVVVERARASGVTRIVAVGGSPTADDAALAAAHRFPGSVLAALGRGRDLAGELARTGLEEAVDELDRKLSGLSAAGVAVAALGEIGLDFHYAPDTAHEQVELFRAQLELARERGLPVIVHSRDAEGETLRELRVHAGLSVDLAGRVGVLHCFTGGAEFAGELVDMGYHLGFSGIITFKNASALREVLATVPDERVLIETDSPYLAPVPYRGKPNEPAYLPHVAAAVAEVRGVTVERLAGITTRNAERLFGVGQAARS